MKRISRLFTEISRGWVAVFAVIVFVMFMAFVLPGQASQAELVSDGAGSPDTSLWYSSDELLHIAEAYGEAGRAAYVRARWTFDLVYPLVYAFFLITAISWLFTSSFPKGSTWQLANLIPFVGMLFDYLENSATTIVMTRFPDPAPIATNLAPLLTLLKWVFVGGSFVVLLIGLVMWVTSRLRKR